MLISNCFNNPRLKHAEKSVVVETFEDSFMQRCAHSMFLAITTSYKFILTNSMLASSEKQGVGRSATPPRLRRGTSRLRREHNLFVPAIYVIEF